MSGLASGLQLRCSSRAESNYAQFCLSRTVNTKPSGVGFPQILKLFQAIVQGSLASFLLNFAEGQSPPSLFASAQVFLSICPSVPDSHAGVATTSCQGCGPQLPSGMGGNGRGGSKSLKTGAGKAAAGGRSKLSGKKGIVCGLCGNTDKDWLACKKGYQSSHNMLQLQGTRRCEEVRGRASAPGRRPIGTVFRTRLVPTCRFDVGS